MLLTSHQAHIWFTAAQVTGESGPNIPR